MLREVSQKRADKAMGACPVCQWPYGSGSIFCSSCGIQLARLEVSPKSVEPLTLFEGFPVIMRFENTGKIPVELARLDGVEWDSEANWPVSLEPKEKTEIRRRHTGRLGQRGRLTLHSTLSPISFRYRVQKAPRIWLADEQGREFGQGTDGAQLWPVNQEAQRHELALRATSEVVLEKPPRLSKGDQVVDIVPAEEVSYPFRLGPDKAFSVRLTQNQPLSEEGHPVHLVFLIQNIGDVDFRLNLKYTLRPVIKVDFNPLSLSGDTALISGSRKPKEVSATITHLRGAPLSINSATSDTSWLQVVNPPRKVLLDSQSAAAGADGESVPNLQLQLQVKTTDIRRTTKSKHFEPEIIIKGEAIGAEDSAFEERHSLSVEVIPPKPLDYPIGIDFGTTNSCLAYFKDEEQTPQLAELEEGEPRVEVPTVFQLLATNKKTERLELSEPLKPNEHHLVATENEEAIMHFGRQPFQQMNGRSLNDNNDVNEFWNFMSSICWSFKYALNQPDVQNFYVSNGMSGILINGHPSINRRHISLTPVDQVAIYLRFMVEHFTGESGYSPSEVVLTYPAVFNRQKQALQDAAEKALQDRDIKLHLAISEPEAIAVDYVWRQQEDKPEDDMGEQIIGVFDCGGGTTDMSIVRYTMDDDEAQVEILGSDGDNQLGGNLLTFHLAKYFYERIVPEQYRSRYPFAKDLRDGLRTQDPSVKRNFLRLYQLAEEIKTNSKRYELFDACFPQHRYDELIKRKDKGLLELLASDEKMNWPNIELVSREEGDVLRVAEGLKRSINDDALPEELSSIDYEAIRSVLSRELERGFTKLAMMQKALFEREIIAEFRLDHLILAGNSSKLPIVKEVAQEMIQAKEFSDSALSGSNNGLKASVASGAAIYSMSQRDPEFRLQVFGINKLNYPIGSYTPMRGFSPIFDRWTSLNKEEVHPYASKVFSKDGLPRISLYEFFDWNYRNRKADRHRVADIPMPLENRAFKQAAYWQYKLELRGDENNRGQLYYNFAVG